MEATVRCPWCAEEILAAAKKCKHCGEFLTADDAPKALSNTTSAVPPEATSHTTATSSAAECPVCERADVVQRISAVIDSGTSTTQGAATTGTVGVSTKSGVGVSTSDTAYAGTTTSALARRFGIPPEEKSQAPTWVYVLGFAVGAQVWSVNPYLALVTGPVGAVLAAVIYDGRPAAKAKRRAWIEGRERLRAAYYCARDDVAFEPTNREALSPERLGSKCFHQFWSVKRDASTDPSTRPSLRWPDRGRDWAIAAGALIAVALITVLALQWVGGDEGPSIETAPEFVPLRDELVATRNPLTDGDFAIRPARNQATTLQLLPGDAKAHDDFSLEDIEHAIDLCNAVAEMPTGFSRIEVWTIFEPLAEGRPGNCQAGDYHVPGR